MEVKYLYARDQYKQTVIGQLPSSVYILSILTFLTCITVVSLLQYFFRIPETYTFVSCIIFILKAIHLCYAYIFLYVTSKPLRSQSQ